MPIAHKPISEQVIVITGASSGIGLVTVKSAATQGARVVLAARNRNALEELCRGIKRTAGMQPLSRRTWERKPMLAALHRPPLMNSVALIRG